MKYMTLYIEVEPTTGVSDGELSSATQDILAGAQIRSRDGAVIGEIMNVQVTEGPKPVRAVSIRPLRGSGDQFESDDRAWTFVRDPGSGLWWAFHVDVEAEAVNVAEKHESLDEVVAWAERWVSRAS